MKFQKPHFIELPEDYEVEAEGYKKKVWINPTGIHMTYDRSNVYINYADENADESYAKIQVPSEPKYLRKLSRQINKMAKEIDER